MPRLGGKNLLARGIERHSRSDAYHRKGLWAKKKTEWKKTPKKVVKKEPKVKDFGKEGKKQKREIKYKHPRFYSAEQVPKPVTSRKIQHPTRLRPSITPGTVVILLAGRFRGKRVVFLKQLSSGLLLVTGPYAVNGVPVRRVNQRYVIATSTKVDITGVDVAKFDDAYFKRVERPKKTQSKSTKAAPAAKEPAKEGEKKKKPKRLPKQRKLNPERIADQKAVDAKIVEAVKKVTDLERYLHARFSLSRSDVPHLLKF
eukprot:TRINITY_DN1897_c0_g1_i1.p1 TRINITY_DN1897_c0_g1~~TRINITY_DN1897_c0_g1_i1.p1  ORF type:complete len:257 (-),score=73.10 TRINITY_DN1897_c0_g1_i1:41-811(-)